MSYIIHNVSNNSLIIIDELGRGTSPEEGIGVCHSICEFLINYKVLYLFYQEYIWYNRQEAKRKQIIILVYQTYVTSYSNIAPLKVFP